MTEQLVFLPIVEVSNGRNKIWKMQGLVLGAFRDMDELSEFIHEKPLPADISRIMINPANGHIINVSDLVKPETREDAGQVSTEEKQQG